MRLVDVKNLKVMVNGEELAMRELKENENYYLMQFYKENIRKGYNKEFDYYTMGETKEEILSELDTNARDKKAARDNFRYTSDEIVNSSALLFNEEFVKGKIKLEDLAEVERNKDGKILHYKVKPEYCVSEEAEFKYDEKGNPIHVNFNNKEYEIQKIYDTKGRIAQIVYYIDGEFVYKESTSYYENYEETLCHTGAYQNINRRYYDDKKRPLVEFISDGIEFNKDDISAISTYEYLDNGDVIEESLIISDGVYNL
jgi:hypothetical protein